MSIAAVIASVAALVVALHVGVAQADTPASRIGRYQLVREDSVGFAVMDTTDGHIFEQSAGTESKWVPLADQFDAATAARARP